MVLVTGAAGSSQGLAGCWRHSAQEERIRRGRSDARGGGRAGVGSSAGGNDTDKTEHRSSNRLRPAR